MGCGPTSNVLITTSPLFKDTETITLTAGTYSHTFNIEPFTYDKCTIQTHHLDDDTDSSNGYNAPAGLSLSYSTCPGPSGDLC